MEFLGSSYFMFLVDRAHQCRSGWQDFVDEDEDGLLWGKLDALADNVHELSDSKVGGYQVLLLIDGCDVRLLDLLTYDLDEYVIKNCSIEPNKDAGS